MIVLAGCDDGGAKLSRQGFTHIPRARIADILARGCTALRHTPRRTRATATRGAGTTCQSPGMRKCSLPAWTLIAGFPCGGRARCCVPQSRTALGRRRLGGYSYGLFPLAHLDWGRPQHQCLQNGCSRMHYLWSGLAHDLDGGAPATLSQGARACRFQVF